MNYNTIGRWENECNGIIPSLKDMLSLCEVFDCDLTYLLCEHSTKRLTTNDIQKVIGLSARSIEILSKWVAWADAGEVSSVDKETIQARQKILSFLIENEDVVGLLSDIYCRLFGNLYMPLFRNDKATEKQLHERALVFKENKGCALTPDEEADLIFKNLDYDMISSSVPLVFAGGNKRLHNVVLGSKELSRIYNDSIIEALGILRKIAEQETQAEQTKKMAKNGKEK